jgi:two-component system, chemotaxis family, protein-glutamate methylesterase/glutaminase
MVATAKVKANNPAWQDKLQEQQVNLRRHPATKLSPEQNNSKDIHARDKMTYHVVALAASAGGLQALTQVLSGLPAGFAASVVVVQHLDPRHRSLMAEILSRRIHLPVKQAEDGEFMQTGRVYIAPPDQHLLVNADRALSLTHTELVHFVRPSADLLFESVAASFKERTVAVVLSGTGMDGALGVKAIKEMGGIVIVQDEQTSEFFGMPQAAIHTGKVDFILPLGEIAPTLINLVAQG